METPMTYHLSRKDFENLYEPAEDTFLLMDALETDLPYLEKLAPRVCLEIGAGAGLIITALSKKLKNTLCLATDINPYACNATKLTGVNNFTHVDVVRCNLADGIRAKSVDLLVFNPPYVCTTDEELEQQTHFDHISGNLVYSWAGGLNGRRVIDVLIQRLDSILSESGVMYLLLLRENNIEEILIELDKLKFDAFVFTERHVPGEYLYILKVTRKLDCIVINL